MLCPLLELGFHESQVLAFVGGRCRNAGCNTDPSPEGRPSRLPIQVGEMAAVEGDLRARDMNRSPQVGSRIIISASKVHNHKQSHWSHNESLVEKFESQYLSRRDFLAIRTNVLAFGDECSAFLVPAKKGKKSPPGKKRQSGEARNWRLINMPFPQMTMGNF